MFFFVPFSRLSLQNGCDLQTTPLLFINLIVESDDYFLVDFLVSKLVGVACWCNVVVDVVLSGRFIRGL